MMMMMLTSINVGLFLVLFLFAYQIHMCYGDEVYKVGDSSGWTIIGNVDYKQWASSKFFQVGDTILFEYNPKFHNVLQVTHGEYKSCNATSPISTHTTGNDSITITGYGHHFFLCGVPGHCQSGQKVDINVIRPSSPAAAAQPVPPAGAALPSPKASGPPTIVSAPTSSDASSSRFALYNQILAVIIVIATLHLSII